MLNLDGWPIPPAPDLPPPGHFEQFFALSLGVLLLAETLTLLLPEPWRYALFHAVFERVWPFSAVDKWIRAQLGKGE